MEATNRSVEACLRRERLLPGDPYYRARPILVTSNDYRARLFNGDVGICWPDDGRAWVWFPDEEAGLRRMAPARLPAHETAWAMTVHKSQGSEFDGVTLVLPDRDAPVVTRELLYTGVTRARQTVDVVGDPALIRTWVGRTGNRGSGLAEALSSG